MDKRAGRAEDHVGGIDVGKETLQVALMPGLDETTVPNTAGGGAKLGRWLHRRGVTRLVLEATNTDHQGVGWALADAGFAGTAANPPWLHDFAKSLGQLKKTEPAEARMLGRDGAERHPAPTAVPSPEAWQLTELVRCRDDLVNLKVREELPPRPRRCRGRCIRRCAPRSWR